MIGSRWLTLAAEMAGLTSGSRRPSPDPASPDPASPDPASPGPVSLPRVATRTLGADAGSVRAARDFTIATLRRWGTTERSQDIAIVVSELLTNALRHGLPGAGESRPRRPIRFGLLQPGSCVLCAVADPSRAAPVLQTRGSFAETGRGLHIICALSDQWGFTPSDTGKVVWAMFCPRLTARLAPQRETVRRRHQRRPAGGGRPGLSVSHPGIVAAHAGRRALPSDSGRRRHRSPDTRAQILGAQIVPSSVPVIDLAPWLSGDDRARAAVAAEVDAALRSVGFFLISGHGVPDELRAQVRARARAFFALPGEAKQRYAVTVGGRGWLPTGAEANGYAEGTATPPDLKESFAVGADSPTGDPEVDGSWFRPNVYPAEVPALEPAVVAYLARMRALADELLVLCAAALGLERDFFTRHTGHATHTMNINWYPPMAVAGPPEPGQFRIGPHTDFGTVTILDREPGRGGLQVWTGQDGWEDAPYQPGTFTINTGDLLAHWSGGRWKSSRHRVLPPQAEAPDEDLVSLVYFYEADHDAVIESLKPPIGPPNDYPPVVCAQFIKKRLDAITIG
jgi:isopenicillin N synthase-like dioxygenase